MCKVALMRKRWEKKVLPKLSLLNVKISLKHQWASLVAQMVKHKPSIIMIPQNSNPSRLPILSLTKFSWTLLFTFSIFNLRPSCSVGHKADTWYNSINTIYHRLVLQEAPFTGIKGLTAYSAAAAAAAKALQSCPTLWDPIDDSPPGSTVPGILQARTLEWVAISFSNAWKWSLSVVSDSSRPHGLQPTRLLHPWDSPGKSTGVGCHCLLLTVPPR